jgi:hypothetical protein
MNNISNVIPNDFPKVLIIGETFRTNGGGGITLINLFKDWPAEKLAVVTDNIAETSPDSNCSNYYQLGHLEKKTMFPFNLVKQVPKSGSVKIPSSKTQSINLGQHPSMKASVRSLYNKMLVFSGLYYLVNKIVVSEPLLNWIKTNAPDILYVQPFRYDIMTLAREIGKATKIPIVIHVMDDSVSILNKPNLLYFYWKNKINENFKNLVNLAAGHLSISHAMSNEFLNRYNKNFIPFRNPIIISDWTPFIKNSWDIEEHAKFIYTGRLAIPNIEALFLFCDAIDYLNNNGNKISLDIFSMDNNLNFSKKIKKLKGITINKALPYSKIPELISHYDATLLPIDFSTQGLKYAQFSVSTKTSEYMISGVPVFLLAPKGIALTEYAEENKCMFAVCENNKNSVVKEIERFINDKNLRSSIAIKAIEQAKNDSDAVLIRTQFKKVISQYIY